MFSGKSCLIALFVACLANVFHLIVIGDLSCVSDNAYIESFNGEFRNECLNAHWFMTLDDAPRRWRNGVETTTRFALTAPSATDRRYHS